MTLSRTNVVLALLLAIVSILAIGSRIDYSKPNYEFLPDMKYTPAWTTYSPNPNFANRRTLQAPVSGTIARGTLPQYFESTPEDALRAGEQLLNPYAAATDDTVLVDSPESEEQDSSDKSSNAAIAAAEQAKRLAAVESRLQQSILRGGETFRVFCVCCHGPGGAGDGTVPQKGFPPPPSLLTGKSRQMQDGQLFHIVTYGQGSMPNLAAQVPQERRWDVINFVRSLQEGAPEVE